MKQMARYSRLLSGLALCMAVTMACSGDAVDITGMTASGDRLKVADKLSFGGNETAASLAVESNCSWTVTKAAVNGADNSWLTVVTTSGDANTSKIQLTTTVINPSALDERQCRLVVQSADGIRREVVVTQRPASEILTVTPTALTIVAEEADGELTAAFTVTSNAQWTVSGIVPWISLSYTGEDGTVSSDNTIRGSKAVTVTAQTNPSENARECKLTITGTSTGADFVKEVTVSQLGRTVVISTDPGTLPDRPAKGASYTFNVVGNAQWQLTADSDLDWFDFSPKSGQGRTVSEAIPVTVTLKDNASGTPRTVTLTATSESGKTATCVISQVGAAVPTLTGSVDNNSVGRNGATVSAQFSSSLDISECGFCYGLNPGPTVDGAQVLVEPVITSKETDSSVTGNLPATQLADLISGRTYYVRAYARNARGIGYSNEFTFKTTGDVPGEGENPTPNL